MKLEVIPGGKQDDLSRFLHYMYDGLDGYVACATKKVSESGAIDFTRESFKWPLEAGILSDWILENAPHRDVYVAPALFTEKSGKSEHFKITNVVWADFDGQVPSSKRLAELNVPEPTLRVQSSSENKQHWYWRLESPLQDASAVESINRALAYQLGADVSGWDAAQILRPPNTVNHKNGLPVVLLSASTDSVAPTLFDVLPAYEPVHVEVTPEVIPDVTSVLLKYPWPVEASELFLAKISDGSDRSGMLMKLGYFLAEMGMSDAEMFAVLRNADDRWGKFKNRTDRDRRLSDLIGVAREKFPGEIVLADNAIPIYGLLSFLNTEIEIEWVIPGILQSQGYMLLTGPAGVGKTQFSLRWAISLALGRNFLGHEIAQPKRILFWSLEMGHPDLKSFLATMCTGMSQEDLLLLEQNLLIAPLGEEFHLDVESSQAQFEEIIKEFPVDGVFIDSMGSSASGPITDESTVRNVMAFNDRLRQRHGVFTWFIHHMRKATGDNKKPNKQDDVYGNQYLVNRATSVYCLWPAGNTIEVIPLKKRLAQKEDPWVVQRFGNLDFMKKTTAVSFASPKVSVLGEDDVIHHSPSNGFGEI